MRHKKLGRHLGRTSSHRQAMFKNMASSLFLTERVDEFAANTPKARGRIITTLPKAKEVRRTVERAITIARKALIFERAAAPFATKAERNTEAYKAWRKSEQWQQWAKARAPYLILLRKAIQLIGNRQAVETLFTVIAPRFEHRDGGYTRVLKLAQPRLGDRGDRAILELVGQNDRKEKKASKPAFEST